MRKESVTVELLEKGDHVLTPSGLYLILEDEVFEPAFGTVKVEAVFDPRRGDPVTDMDRVNCMYVGQDYVDNYMKERKEKN